MVAILVGPHTDNFRDIVSVFKRADALRVVTPDSLTSTVLELLQNDSERSSLGQRAREIMAQQQGATEPTITALLQLLPAQSNSSPAAVVAERNA